MVALYVTSLERHNGKTTVCAGLGKHLLSDSKKVGFFKPVIADSKTLPTGSADSDATFIKRIFALELPVDLLCPVFGDESQLRSNIKEAYVKVSQGKDVVIVEGTSDHGQASRAIVETLDAKVIIVEDYIKGLSKSMNSYKEFGDHLLGIVLNKVPKRRIKQVRDETSTQFDRAGIKVLGILPEDRTLLALTIGELAEHIQGELLSGSEKSAVLVENIMLGAMCVDPGPYYFSRQANKAVVLRSERPDMQLAALETSTECLVLTGDMAPKPVVLYQAEEKNVPIILAKDNITTVVKNIEDTLGKTRFNQENKLAKLNEIMEQHLDFPTIYKGLGLSS